MRARWTKLVSEIQQSIGLAVPLAPFALAASPPPAPRRLTKRGPALPRDAQPATHLNAARWTPLPLAPPR